MRLADPRRSALARLEREEELALADLKRTLVAAGEDLCALAEVREFTRRHPELAVLTSAALGAALAPSIAGAARTALPLLLREMTAGSGGGLELLRAIKLRMDRAPNR